MAPHVFVEEITLAGIRDALALAARSGLLQRFGRHHADAGAIIKAWHQTWLNLAFHSWNIEENLPAIPAR